MNASDANSIGKAGRKNMILANLAFWLVGMLLYPLAQIVPTGSGEPPKIFSLLIPIIFMLLAFGSTSLLSKAIGPTSGDDPSDTGPDR